ncbi:T9SS type A sorting domain-containing protein [Hymenobacter volaticus]|uniref:T9SS type A sorting domain-containing protein n=1 Tax=Hymenobacter volaticus TaxID=2932254 RepID=A0ABY4GF77_9BACT|nr:T9SS type A sorting domain-containing protein [Hymenobacter volaticus]UOQ69154.1 T9SS type A sorting domain-containing protein [Hymenobacter volaticus]
MTAAGAGGRGQSSAVFHVTILPAGEAVTIFPNPTREKVTISWHHAQFVVEQVRIYDTLGRLIATEAVPSAAADELTVLLTSYRAGLYIAVIETPAGRVVKRITLL